MENLKFIFVHGLCGWGSYDRVYRKMPYWGMRGGDLISHLRKKGFDCYAASVAPTGSAWDRACELYAQIAGCRVDYGQVHSSTYHHERFGRDFSADPLIPDWNEESRIVLLGHSFGGATVRVFSQLLAGGDPAERAAARGEDLSALFCGGMQSRIHSIVTLASPMNGTTAYDMFEDPAYDPGTVKASRWSRILAYMMSKGTAPKMDGRDAKDYADHDMHLDRAMEMNRQIETLPSVYYFSVPCSAVKKQPDGTYRHVRGIEPLFVLRADQIGSYTGHTENGYVIDESWMENDGLVNTISSMAPQNAPSKPLDREHIEPGIWNVHPVISGDHMWLQGGLLRKHDIRGFYEELLDMIDSIAVASC